MENSSYKNDFKATDNVERKTRKAFANLTNIDGRTDRVPRKTRTSCDAASVEDFDMCSLANECDDNKIKYRFVFLIRKNYC